MNEYSDLEAAIDDEDANLLENTNFEEIDWPNVFCDLPFVNLSIGNHKAHFCCYARSKYWVKYAGDDLTILDVWNNPKFVEARKFMHEGKASEVCKVTCPHLPNGGLKNALMRNS